MQILGPTRLQNIEELLSRLPKKDFKFFWSINFVFCHQAKKAFHVVLVSKFLLIFLNLDIQLKGFPQTAFCEIGFSFVIFFLPLKTQFHLSLNSNISSHILSIHYRMRKKQIILIIFVPDIAQWHHFYKGLLITKV
jgi:hypothetical protein